MSIQDSIEIINYTIMKKILVQLLLVLIVSNVNAQEWSKELEKRAKKGDIEAVVEVGNAYFKGNGVKRDLEKAAKWYYEAIQRGKDEVKENFYSFYSKQLEKYAKSGDAQAQYEVGCAYQKGDGVDRNVKTAAEWFLLAGEQGHEKAMDKFHSFYSKELEKRAKSGQARAQYELGNCYLNAIEIDRDAEEAAEWYKKAMMQGHEQAKEQFYSFYSKMLEKTAKEGDARAQYETGNAYLTGNGVKKDNETAAEWYLKAIQSGHEGAKEKFYSFYSKILEKRAKAGDAEAQFQTGNGYFEGYAVKKDNNTAAKWYQMAMKQGHEQAKEKFYSFYSKLLEKSAKDGDARAQFETGNSYLNANGVDKDSETAAEWYLKAMEQEYEGAKEMFYSFYSKKLEKRAKSGDAEAQYRIGECYFLGGQVKRDIEEAAEWLEKSMLQGHEAAKERYYSFYSKTLEKRAKGGDAEAQFQVGNFYHKGGSVDRNIETAAQWYMKAKDQGHEGAKESFYSFYSKTLEKSAKTDIESMYVIGCFYMEGNQVEKNMKKATKYLATAVEKGHEQAFEKLSASYNKDLEKLAKKGNKRAQLAVGKCYLEGIGVKKDKKKASKLLVKLKEDPELGEEVKLLLEKL